MSYFDHNATSPLSPTARQAWLDAVDRYPANPSSPHRLGARADHALTEARHRIAAGLGCSPFDIVWISGATEANNALFHSLAQKSQGEIWISSIEHPSLISAAERWCGSRLHSIPVLNDGQIDLDWLDDALKKRRPEWVCVMAANNETGVLQPWMEALQLCRQNGVGFACDAAQWLGRLPAAGLGDCDFVTASAHKFGGPLGIGWMKVPKSFSPLLVGGPQEEGRRAGTENVPAVLAMLAAWEECERRIQEGETVARCVWRDEFIRGIQESLGDVEIVGGSTSRLWNTVAALMPRAADCRKRWVVQLDKLGFSVSTGAACSSGKEKPSHVLAAMGYDGSQSDRMLRFSAGWNTQLNDWESLRQAVQTAAQALR